MRIAAVLQEDKARVEPVPTASSFPAITPRPIGAETVATANGREVHKSLKVRRDFTTWIKARIEEYGFVAGIDYVVITAPPIRGAGNRGAKDEYFCSIAMAKELAMVENDDQGRAVRRYFMECERQAKAGAAPAIPQTLPEALRLAADLAEQVQALAPKAEALDRITAADGEQNITTAAKTLQVDPKKLFETLEERKWIYRRNSGRPTAYQTQIHAGRLRHRITTFTKADGTTGSSSTVLVTPKGLTAIAALLNVHPPNAPS